MKRAVEDLISRPELDSFAPVHDQDMIGHVCHHAQVVSDHDDGGLSPGLDFLH
jgi:hypothetical protein